MNKNELIERISEKAGLSKNDAGNALEAVTDTIKEVVKSGSKLVLVGFGTFESAERSARTGRHPRTGEPMQIAASKYVKFKMGKDLKDTVNS